MNIFKLTTVILATFTLILSAIVYSKSVQTIKELKSIGLTDLFRSDPTYRAFMFMNNTSIALAVLSGILLIVVLVSIMFSGKFNINNKKYKIVNGLLSASCLVASAFIIYFTSDTVIESDTNLSTVITSGDSNEPMGKNKSYYPLGLTAGVLGILTVGSICIYLN